MATLKKNLDPDLDLKDDEEDPSLPQLEDEAPSGFEEAAATGLAAGRAAIIAHARHAPTAPGVYRMLDRAGEVLYVGKAKNIRKRIVAYARPTGHDTRIERMIAATARLEFVSTATETEALLLEANLIKRLRPRFNVLMRDDKSFPYILITKDHPAPQIMKHRGARNRRGRLLRAVCVGPGGAPHDHRARARVPASAPARTRCSTAARAPVCCIRSSAARLPAPARSHRPIMPTLVGEAKAFLAGRSHAVREELAREMEAGGRDARLRARRRLSRPSRRAIRHPGPSGDQPAQRLRGRRVRRPSAGWLHLHPGVLLPHRAELGQPRLFPQGRPLAVGGRGAGVVPGAVLRRQAVPALRPRLARRRRPGAARRSADDQERPSGGGRGSAARRTQGPGRSRARQCQGGARTQARRNLLATTAARWPG